MTMMRAESPRCSSKANPARPTGQPSSNTAGKRLRELDESLDSTLQAFERLLICDHGATPKRSSQDHRQPAAPQSRSHQGLPLSNPSRWVR
ncbi:hypothetical protein HZH66_010637 [Vespula vulgaris]|uniref:Uncharacterized protein n=1 Tax=Vespula vulgaris TaxID=7454 RepID=A0A834MWI2_VESVU|nr:hypothetical protein HZH66_010637 [Vespula vulgaris]